MPSVNVVGAFKGQLTLPQDFDTVKELRLAVARALGLPPTAAPSLKLIVSGKTLRDDAAKLSDEGALSRAVLVLRGAADVEGDGAAAAAPTRLSAAASATAALDAKLEALKAAADRLVSSSSSSSGRGGRGVGELVLETSDGGDALSGLTENEKKAIKLGLALAAKGKETLERACRRSPSPGGASNAASIDPPQRRRRIASEALAELDVASQALSLVIDGDNDAPSSSTSSSSPSSPLARLLRRADNVALLHLDWAWAAYLAGEPSRLAAATEKLRQAREALQASHGADRSLARAAAFLGGGSPAADGSSGNAVCNGPEAALYVRLDVLEGIAAAASGRPTREAVACLERAAEGWKSWQALPEGEDGIGALTSMGFTRAEARRALRFVGGNSGGRSSSLDAAAAAAVDLRRAARDREERFAGERRARSAATRFEKYHSGGSSSSPSVSPRIDVSVVLEVMKLGYEPELAAAAVALSDVENSYQSAVDALGDVERNLMIQTAVEAVGEARCKRKRQKRERGAQVAAAAAAGFARSDDENDDDQSDDDNNSEARAAERALLRSLEATRSSDPLSAYLDVELDLEGSALVTWLARLGKAEAAEELKRAGAKQEEGG